MLIYLISIGTTNHHFTLVPQRQAHEFAHGWLRNPVHMETSTMIGRAIMIVSTKEPCDNEGHMY